VLNNRCLALQFATFRRSSDWLHLVGAVCCILGAALAGGCPSAIGHYRLSAVGDNRPVPSRGLMIGSHCSHTLASSGLRHPSGDGV
jgi:hypothetical protein